MENKNFNGQYKCSFCGSMHESAVNRARCELSCAKKREEEEIKKAAELKKQQQEARKAEVDAAIENAIKLRNAYLKDYDSYSYNVELKPGEANWNNHKSLWHYFL